RPRPGPLDAVRGPSWMCTATGGCGRMSTAFITATSPAGGVHLPATSIPSAPNGRALALHAGVLVLDLFKNVLDVFLAGDLAFFERFVDGDRLLLGDDRNRVAGSVMQHPVAHVVALLEAEELLLGDHPAS